MSIKEPLPELSDILVSIGEGGLRVAQIDAGEGAAGNISVCVGWPIDPRRHFPVIEEIPLPVPAPHLVGRVVIVTGSGRRLRDIAADTAANLGAVRVLPGGETGLLHTSPRRLFDHLTSEWNSHLAVHDDTVARTDTNYHAVVHAQPPHLVYLSHVPAYRDEERFNRQLLRWEPETIVNLPAGVGVLPFMVPGSDTLMAANVESLRSHRIVLWGKHGVMARSDISVTRAVDRIEYAETAARYEYMDLANGGRAEGLTPEEMGSVIDAFGVRTTVF
ncbi:MAG: class II aldolase/adducin family protein [Chloroflexi bacterium]|nr:class II aldolase/adducin family protein [Chloroflexota bacterium]